MTLLNNPQCIHSECAHLFSSHRSQHIFHICDGNYHYTENPRVSIICEAQWIQPALSQCMYQVVSHNSLIHHPDIVWDAQPWSLPHTTIIIYTWLTLKNSIQEKSELFCLSVHLCTSAVIPSSNEFQSNGQNRWLLCVSSVFLPR